MRVLFFNEGNLGTHVLGQAQLDQALRVGLSAVPDVEGRFAGLTPLGRWGKAATDRTTPTLVRLHLDFRTFRWHLVQSLRARARVRAELQQWPADVVHVHSQSIALTMASVMRTVPVVLSVDTTVRDWSNMPAWAPTQRYAPATIAPSRALERRALRRAALVLAWSAWARAEIEAQAPGTRVIEHHPGIDLERYRPAPRRERERPRVLFVGGRFAAKGGEDLLEALGDGLGRDWDLDIVTPADVPERPGVRVHRLSGSDPRLLDLQQQADVMCLATYGDANPWVLLEAMASGTPVVSTPVGGIADMLDHGSAGVLVPYGDPQKLGEALRGLLSNPDERARLADTARARCEARYDARRQFASLAERLATLGTQPGGRRRTSMRTSSASSARSPNSSAG